MHAVSIIFKNSYGKVRAELGFYRASWVFFCFWSCRGLMRMLHGMPEIEMNDDLNFSAIAHSDKQISRQTSTMIVFSNALVETLLTKLRDSALYVLFGSYRKTERITVSRSMLFSNAADAPVCFHAESTAANLNP